MRIPFLSFNFLRKASSKVVPEFRKLTSDEVLTLKSATQEFCDCYLVTAMASLASGYKGREIIKQQITKAQVPVTERFLGAVSSHVHTEGQTPTILTDVYNVVFKNVKNKPETYEVNVRDLNKYYWITHKQKNKTLGAMEIAMQKLVGNHFFKKPWIARLKAPFLYEKFEFNLVSNFMEMFTGKKPINIGEKNLNVNLKPYKKEVLELFDKIGKSYQDGYSFVAGTGVKHIGRAKAWHCYVLKSVDLQRKEVVLINKRTNVPNILSFDEAIDKLKYIVGYFGENLG